MHRAVRRFLLPLSLSASLLARGGEPERLRLRELVAEAIARHPEVRRARGAAAAAREVPSRVGAPPDPVLGLQAQNIRIDQPALDTSPMSAIQFGVTEAIPFPGKLGRRRAVAEGRAAALSRDLEATETGVALAVRRAYWRLHFAERAEAIVAESARIMNGLANAVIARLAVGKALQQDALQAQVTQSRIRARLEESREAVTSARRALNGAVGRAPSADLPPTEPPPAAPAPLDREALLLRAREGSPQLRASRARLETARRAVAEAEYDRWPDLAVGLGYRLRAVVPGDPSRGADMFGATLGVTLPVFLGAKQNARVRETREQLRAAEAALDAADLEVSTRLQRLLDAVERLDREMALYRSELLPEADKALDASIADYQVGGVGFVSVLQNWQTQLDARLAQERLRSERAEREAEVNALVERETAQ